MEETETTTFITDSPSSVADVQNKHVELPNGPPLNNPWLSLLRDAADLMKEELPPVVEIVEGIVAEGSKLVIGSGGKTFKTWLSMLMAIAISHGLPFLGRRTTRCKVLYVNLELKEKTFTRRLQAIAKALNVTIDPDWLIHLPLRGKLSGGALIVTISRIIEIAQLRKAGVVVAEPVYKLNTEGDENSSRDQTRLFNELDRITTEAQCTLILNDHFGKGNQSEKEPLDAIRGSSAKGADVDAAMILRKHEEEGCFRVDLIHRELPPVEPFCIGWNFPLMELRPDLDADDMKKAGGQTRKYDPIQLLVHIAHTTPQDPISISEWARLANVERTTLNGYTSWLRTKGLIATTGEGNNARQYITKAGLARAAKFQ